MSYIDDQIRLAAGQGFASPEAESAFIWTMLTRPREHGYHVTEVTPYDFTKPERRAIVEAVQAVTAKRQAVDIVTVMDAARKLHPDYADAIEGELMQTLSGQFYSAANIGEYIRVIKELSTRRNAITAMENALQALHDPTRETGDIMTEIRAETGKADGGGSGWTNIQTLLLNTYEWLEKRAKGEEKAVTTGISNIDALIGGFFPGELTVIGARPGVGKSAFALNIAMESARRGFKVGIVSREMTDIQFGQRILARASRLDGMKLRKADIQDDDWAALTEAMTLTGDLPIAFLFNARTVEDIRAEIARRQQTRGEALDILIVDYLQLVNTQRRFRDEHLRVGYISHTLKDIATDCHIPVIALAQVNRDSDGQMPTMRNLKDSGDIEQDADGILFLHRPKDGGDPFVDPRDRAGFDAYAETGFNYIVIHVAKQRQGSVGKAAVLFDPARATYSRIERIER